MDAEKELIEKIISKLRNKDTREERICETMAEEVLDIVWESRWFEEVASEWAREQGWREPR